MLNYKKSLQTEIHLPQPITGKNFCHGKEKNSSSRCKNLGHKCAETDVWNNSLLWRLAVIRFPFFPALYFHGNAVVENLSVKTAHWADWPNGVLKGEIIQLNGVCAAGGGAIVCWPPNFRTSWSYLWLDGIALTFKSFGSQVYNPSSHLKQIL